MTTSAARLLVYSQDGFGLGHMRRTSLLAGEFLAARPDASALTISDSPLGHFFSASQGHDYLKLPSIRKAGPGRWGSVSLSMAFSEVLELRRQIIRSTVLSYRPDIVLVDHMPHGAMGELVPTLEALESLPVRVVLGLRDILDAPATIRQRWHLEGAFEVLERYYDDVLVYGSQDVFDVSAQYDWPDAARSRLRYCGYVCADDSPAVNGRSRTRHLRGARDGDLIVAMAGGGADAYPLFDALIDAVPRLTAERPCSIVIVTGPFLPAAERIDLLRRARGLPVRVLKSVSDTGAYMRSADLVVSMAGYNTSVELLKLGQRALLVPRAGPSAEQQMRAALFAERGWVDWLPPAEMTADALAAAMLGSLAKPVGTPAAPPDLDGLSAATAHLVGMTADGGRDGVAVNDTLSVMARARSSAGRALGGS
jgi:predicted glycosyltransferase